MRSFRSFFILELGDLEGTYGGSSLLSNHFQRHCRRLVKRLKINRGYGFQAYILHSIVWSCRCSPEIQPSIEYQACAVRHRWTEVPLGCRGAIESVGWDAKRWDYFEHMLVQTLNRTFWSKALTFSSVAQFIDELRVWQIFNSANSDVFGPFEISYVGFYRSCLSRWRLQ